jgi:pectinesterase
MERKIFVSGVSLILVVGVALGVVALVRTNNGPTDANNGELNSHTKAVTAVCQTSDDKKFCADTLNPVNTSDPNDYIKAVVKTSIESVIKAFNMTDKLAVENGQNNQSTKMALDDCKDLLQFAIDELEASSLLANDNSSVRNVNDRAADLKNWLGAVFAYQQSCLDGFDTDGEKQVQSQLQTGSLDHVGKLTALALDVVTAITKVLAALDLDLNVKPSSRRLFEVDEDGNPEWMSGADRKLLADMSTGMSVTPNVVVAKDGSGKFKTVLDAINSYPKNHQGRYVIYVKAGVYDEYIQVDKTKKNILIYGDGPTKTIITGKKNFVDGWKTIKTATFCKSFSIYLNNNGLYNSYNQNIYLD